MIVKHAARKPGICDRLVGQLAYLAGPGTREEHSDQRIIAAWDSTVTDIEIHEPSEQMDLAHEMEFPARIREMEPPRGTGSSTPSGCSACGLQPARHRAHYRLVERGTIGLHQIRPTGGYLPASCFCSVRSSATQRNAVCTGE